MPGPLFSIKHSDGRDMSGCSLIDTMSTFFGEEFP